jgi:pimeloyl-ACP methyl ester carboxylesterase
VDALGIDRAIWIGHDWGAPVVWTTARHHPQRFQAVGSLSTPYDTLERGFERMVSFVRRDVYPEQTYPAGQFDYDSDNRSFVASARRSQIEVPTLFVAGRWDYVNDTEYSGLADPMRSLCTNLDYRVLDAGHWIQNERRDDVTHAIDTWARHTLQRA